MKTRTKRIISCILALLAVPATLLALAFGLPPQYGETFLGALQDKVETLTQAQGGRIILAGGSGAAFGMRSDLLAQELPGHTVVNLGMYAGLGSTVTLELAMEQVRAGDVVVFMPEQSEQTLSMYLNAESMWQAADGAWFLLGAARKDWRKLAGQLPSFAAQKAKYFFQGNPPTGEGVYARSSFNRWGDIDYPLRGQNVMSGNYDPNMLISFDSTLPTEDFIAYLNDCAARCADKGASLYYAFCPMNAAAVTAKEWARAGNYAQTLATRLSFPVLGQVQDAIMEDVWFYDTNFHLNSAGAVVYTARLAEKLKAALGVAGEVSILLPEPPHQARGETVRGDNSDADCFLYENGAEGLRIMGLTEKGAEKTRLIVPVEWQERRVTGFTQATFAGHARVEEIVLQANIRGVEDSSFDGCTGLKRLVVQNASPSKCSVGEGLLQGTAAAVIVPQNSLSAYKTNYFWAVHASRIQGDGVSAEDTAGAAEKPSASAAPAPSAAEETAVLRYDGNGGTLLSGGGTVLEKPMDDKHLRVNTLRGTEVFYRPGYVQIGWNTAQDGSGTSIGLGGRTEKAAGRTLYAQWLPESPAQDFTWTVTDGQAWITGYQGGGGLCVIPAALDGVPVRRVCADAFRGAAVETLVLPSGLFTVEENAFAHCDVREVYLFDSLYYIYDSSFAGCDALTTLHVNAAVKPVYATSYYATFADKYDWLLSLTGKKKLVLFSGSSTRYGYDSVKMHLAFPDYQLANMGVYAYSNALPQMELIRQAMAAGDVLLHSPEFDTLHNQLCGETKLDEHFWAMMEANYDMAALLDLREYTQVFDSMQTYLSNRTGMPKLDYSASPNGFDDDGNAYMKPTYNRYGDYILPRPNGKYDELLQHMRANYTTAPFTPERLAALNREYQRFLDDGIAVYFTYTPRNRSSLTPESTPTARAELDALLRQSLCVPVISDMEKSLYSGIYFYLIDSHLSDEGVRLRTQQVIRDLSPWLNK